MDRSVKILLAASVLLTGTSFAMLFRRPELEVSRPLRGSGEPFSFRERIGPQTTMVVPDCPTVRIESRMADPAILTGQLPTVLKPLDPRQAPPELAKAYPGTPRPHERQDPAEYTRPAYSQRPPIRPRSHKIVDGDTLAALAERYMGDGALWTEIFRANQGVLSSPQLLPIGAILEIPPLEIQPTGATNSMVPKRLVPLVPQAASSATAADAG